MLTALVINQTVQLLYRWMSQCKNVWQILCALVRASYVRARAKKKKGWFNSTDGKETGRKMGEKWQDRKETRWKRFQVSDDVEGQR